MGEYVRSENGNRGELKSRARLVDDFWILDRQVDVDGVDFFIQPKVQTQEDLRESRDSVGAYGAVQAKFCEGSNQVRIPQTYIHNKDGVPRRNYFIFVHTLDADGEVVDFFFTADEVAEHWEKSREGTHYFFALVAGRTYGEFKNLSRRELRETVESNIFSHARHVVRLAASNLLSLHVSRRHADDFIGRYSLCRPHGCPVALYLDGVNGGGHPVEARKDIFQSRGWFEWGYFGEGPKLLSASVLAHFFNGLRPTHREVIFLCENLIGHLKKEAAEFDAKDVFAALAGLPYGCRFEEHPTTQSLYDETKARYLAYFATS